MITIEVTAHNGKALPHPIRADFGDTGGTIGRSPENTLFLLDPDRKISRVHAAVLCHAGNFTLRDQGSIVPVVVNGEPLGNGREVALNPGDNIGIAGYAMSVALTPIRQPTEAAQTAGAADILQSTGEMAAPVLSWDEAEAAPKALGITTVVLAASELVEEGDPAKPAAETSEVANAAESATPLASAVAAPPPIPEAAPRAAPAAPAAAKTTASNDELLRALLSGAGLPDLAIPGGLTPELMRQLGQILREATLGMLDLLAARANTKRQVRADMTVIVAKDNNPLKFSPGAEAALSHFLVPRGRDFMGPVRAVDDAYEDLRAHQRGFMAGMRSALTVVMGRFDPKHLEHRLTQITVVDSLLPMHRKAKLWDLFGQHYSLIAKEAESDFHSLFGQEFLKVYQAHSAKLPDRGSESARR